MKIEHVYTRSFQHVTLALSLQGGGTELERRRGEAGVSTQLGGESEGVKNSEKGSKNDQI